jgi:hypothetical protein
LESDATRGKPQQQQPKSPEGIFDDEAVSFSDSRLVHILIRPSCRFFAVFVESLVIVSQAAVVSDLAASAKAREQKMTAVAPARTLGISMAARPAMPRSSSSLSANTLTFSEIINPDLKQVGGCHLCHLFEGLMTEIFPSPSSSTSDCGSIVSAVVRSQGSSTPTSSLSKKQNSNKNETLRPPPSPRSVCRAWKIKRREQRRRALEGSSALSSSSLGTVSKEQNQELGKENTMPMNNSNWTEREMQCHLKQTAFHIQRNFEQTAQGDVSTSTEEDQSYRYEKYGSRAYFIQDQQEGHAAARSKKRSAVRMRGAPLEQRDDTQDRV